MSRSAPAEAAAVPALRHELARYATGIGADETARRAVELAVSEALTNIVMHAYRDAASPGPMTLEASHVDGYLTVVVLDRGCGMTPRPDSPGIGLGLGLMAQVSDEMRITGASDHGSGTRVAMRFALAGPALTVGAAGD